MKRFSTIAFHTAAVLIQLVWSPPTAASIIADWGIIPIGNETTFVFSPVDATTNFTDQYTFRLIGSTTVNFSSTYFLGDCSKGCGNPVLEFGIYDASGGLIDASGSTVLAAGDYIFQTKGSGMGAGNTAGSGGSISFYTTAPIEVVSPAPEPAIWLLLLAGLPAILIGARRRGKDFGLRQQGEAITK